MTVNTNKQAISVVEYLTVHGYKCYHQGRTIMFDNYKSEQEQFMIVGGAMSLFNDYGERN